MNDDQINSESEGERSPLARQATPPGAPRGNEEDTGINIRFWPLPQSNHQRTAYAGKVWVARFLGRGRALENVQR